MVERHFAKDEKYRA